MHRLIPTHPYRTSFLATTCILLLGCGGSSGHVSSPSGSHTATPVASTYCQGLQPGHALILANVGSGSGQPVVRDVQDPNHGVTLCALPATPRFVSATQIGLVEPGRISVLDLTTGAETAVLAYNSADGPVVTEDWGAGGRIFAYGQLSQNLGSIAFHLIANGTDRVLATVTAPGIGVGVARIEFSPDGKSVALGAPGSAQVWRLDGTRAFSSGGTGQLTWAGESPRLYFQGASGVATWDPTHGATLQSITSWLHPIASPGGRWLAYTVPGRFPAELAVVDTRSGQSRVLGNADDPAWVTSTLIRYTDIVSCPTPSNQLGSCITQSVIYDMSDGTKAASVLAHVFDSWPRGSPAWS